MAKGRVSDEELEEGLASAGGLGGFMSTAGARRDSPFGVDAVRSVRKDRVSEQVRPVVEPVPPVTKIEQSEQTPQPKQFVKAKTKPVKPLESKEPDAAASTVETHSEKVSLPMSAKLRDDLTALATRLQRMRTEKRERITPNTVMRVAIQVFIERFDADKAPISNTEAELLEAVRTHLKWK